MTTKMMYTSTTDTPELLDKPEFMFKLMIPPKVLKKSTKLLLTMNSYT